MLDQLVLSMEYSHAVVSVQIPPIQGFLNKDYKNCRERNTVMIYWYLICLLLVILLSHLPSVDLIRRLKIDKITEKGSSNFQMIKKSIQHHNRWTRNVRKITPEIFSHLRLEWINGLNGKWATPESKEEQINKKFNLSLRYRENVQANSVLLESY